MKYFTPELLARFRSSNEAVAEKAADEWELQAERYAKHFTSIRPQLPRGLAQFLDACSLHDATVKIGRLKSAKNDFAILATLENPERDTAFLFYQLKGEPKITRHPPSSEVAGPPEWMYDELEIVDGGGILFNLFHHPVYRHSILLSDGIEIQVDFTNAVAGLVAMPKSRAVASI